MLAGTLQLGDGGTSGSIIGNVFNHTTLAVNRSDTYTYAGSIIGDGALVQMGPGTTILTGNSFYLGGTTISAGTLQLGNGGTSGSIVGDVVDNGIFAINRSDTYSFGGAISGGGAVVQMGPGTTILTGTNSYSGGTAINAGVLAVAADANLGAATGGLAFNGGTLQFLSGFTTARAVTLNAGGGIIDTNGNSAVLAGAIGGGGGLSKIGAGTLTLTGVSTYSGATTVNAGALAVNGSIANSAVTVNAGAVLSGVGTVGATTINSGGTFAPGNSPGTMTVAGNLAFQSGALYLVQVDPSAASSAGVIAGGTAALAGTVAAAFASGSYVTRSYTILSAAGGLGGTRFGSFGTSNLPAGFTASLAYTNTDVILQLVANLGGGSGGSNGIGSSGLSGNQTNVANALNNFFNNGGALPPGFVSVFGLTGANLANALSALSGEPATGSQQAGFQMTNQFLSVMLDPFVDGRSGVAGASGPALGFAPEPRRCPPTSRSPMPRCSRPLRCRQRACSSVGACGGRPMAAQTAPAAIRRWWGAMICPPTRRGLPAVSTIASRRTRWLAWRLRAAAPTGAWRRALAAARATRSRPASTASPVRGLRISPRRSPTPITGCRPIASPSPAITSPRVSTPRVSAPASKPAIASRASSAGSRPMPRSRPRASARRPTARPTSTAAGLRLPTMRAAPPIPGASSARASTAWWRSIRPPCWRCARASPGRMTR